MLKFKDGVTVYGLQPEALYAIDRCVEIYERHGIDCVITSSRYGDRHSSGSLHYAGLAFDIRTRNLTDSQIPDILADMKSDLGNHYDCIFEVNHYHVEYQPKTQLEYPA